MISPVNHSLRIYTLVSGLIFTPLTFWHMHYFLKPMIKRKLREELESGTKTETVKSVEYNKDSCLHRTLIHDYQKRSESGELAKLRQIFDNSTLNFEMKTSKVDINLEDEKLNNHLLILMW